MRYESRVTICPAQLYVFECCVSACVQVSECECVLACAVVWFGTTMSHLHSLTPPRHLPPPQMAKADPPLDFTGRVVHIGRVHMRLRCEHVRVRTCAWYMLCSVPC